MTKTILDNTQKARAAKSNWPEWKKNYQLSKNTSPTSGSSNCKSESKSYQCCAVKSKV